ncbi:MAG: hypothetical protein HOL77_15350 [Rhodobacteraceae bacterium]|nr:hypothetical protein [Paracoccaceae bacterium]
MWHALRREGKDIARYTVGRLMKGLKYRVLYEMERLS